MQRVKVSEPEPQPVVDMLTILKGMEAANAESNQVSARKKVQCPLDDARIKKQQRLKKYYELGILPALRANTEINQEATALFNAYASKRNHEISQPVRIGVGVGAVAGVLTPAFFFKGHDLLKAVNADMAMGGVNTGNAVTGLLLTTSVLSFLYAAYKRDRIKDSISRSWADYYEPRTTIDDFLMQAFKNVDRNCYDAMQEQRRIEAEAIGLTYSERGLDLYRTVCQMGADEVLSVEQLAEKFETSVDCIEVAFEEIAGDARPLMEELSALHYEAV